MTTLRPTTLRPGSPEPLGVSLSGDGINVAVAAPNAEAVAISLFDAEDREAARLRLPERTGPVFHGHIQGMPAGTRYGLRAYGPWDPTNGHRFNPAKLLIDPWATAIDRPVRLHPLLFDGSAPRPDDTAALMPKAIVGTPLIAPARNRPDFDWDRQVIYELHVRGFTMTHLDIPPDIRGTFAALGHPVSIAHLSRLGVTTVELMPCAAWTDERHLSALNLTNYWGYNPVAFLAPDPRLAPGGWAEIRAAVDALHAAGINVILDVVLNHSGESDALGPTLSLRGLDNATYYRLAADKSLYVNDAGCGNVLAMERALVVRLGMDALRAWALYGGVDGFRLDLAVALGRRDNGFDPDAPFLAAVEQDPLLSRCAMIAEPWDVGAGGHQLGAFPPRWGEWNDHFRDTMRRFWRGDPGMLGDFTTRIAGSADIFTEARPLSRSINYVVAHDGFTLADLVAFTRKRNEANGEHNRDGSDHNLSWNNGVEGATVDPVVIAARARDARALLATLLLARGTPMLSMGDELGRTQHGNNNAYAQDNAGSWIDWTAADAALIDHTTRLIALRQSLAPLFSGRALQGKAIDGSGLPDVAWLGTDGHTLSLEDWRHDDNHTLVAALHADGVRAVLVFHADTAATTITLPPPRPGCDWHRVLDSTGTEPADSLEIPPRSVTVFVEDAENAIRRYMDVADADVDTLAELAGIDPIWWDIDGGYHKVSVETKRTLLAAMRLPAETPGDLADSLARLKRDQDAPLPPVVVARANETVTVRLGTPRPAWITLLRDDGSRERFHANGAAVTLPPQPIGRHRLLNEDRPDQTCHLIVAPDACYLPPALLQGERRFGIAAHLYSLRSKGDQGIGDFTTLRRLASVAAGTGASMVGLNPLHALFPHNRSRASPYHPSDRRFLDPVYIDVSGLPGGAGLPSARGPVDYPAVWERKRAVLQAAFGRVDLTAIPEALRRFATFEAICEIRGTAGWQSWPEALRHPTASGVGAFVAEHGDLVQFHAFLQTLADAQLAEAAASAARDGLSLGFYRDLAVGAAPDGAEAWSAQDTLMRGVSVGAPPDPFSASGQVWCLPPPDPVAMRRDGYASFNELLVANMRHAGALRIDHVMGLRRLFVVPDSASAVDGAYVNYPLQDLLAQVALQSQRARCLIVGEDLGTVPEGMSAALAACNVLSYSVLWFERRDGHIRPPPEWRPLAAACVSTHDLPTLAGWWEGADITEKHGLGLLDDAAADQARAARATEKADLIGQLQADELLQEDADIRGPMPVSVARAVHAFVSATPALLMLVQADDLAGETQAVNLPGTDRERPNWRRRLEPDVEDLCRTPLARAILSALGARVEAGGSL
ncbi:MAG: glycogen debranching protein GlgX [Rhodopila sp.]